MTAHDDIREGRIRLAIRRLVEARRIARQIGAEDYRAGLGYAQDRPGFNGYEVLRRERDAGYQAAKKEMEDETP